MATFRKVEEIGAWKRARELTKKVYASTQENPFNRDFALRDQIRRASISIASNIAEGFDRDGTGEFLQFLSIAKGSVGEVKTQLYLASDLGYLDQRTFNDLFGHALEVGRMIAGLMDYLRTTNLRGTKFRSTRN